MVLILLLGGLWVVLGLISFLLVNAHFVAYFEEDLYNKHPEYHKQTRKDHLWSGVTFGPIALLGTLIFLALEPDGYQGFRWK